MAQLLSYRDFLKRVNDLGFMALSNILPGFPFLSEETPEENWHTGDPETDPWQWKDRAAEEKQLAFGCILGGHKGFVSARFYPLFYAAFHPTEPMTERRASGLVTQEAWQLWQLFEDKTMLNTSDIRQELGVTAKKGGGRVDKAIQELQRNYYITAAGNRRKINRQGQPYGWPAIVYDKVKNWAPREWISLDSPIGPSEAKEDILDQAIAISKSLTRGELTKALGIE